MLNLAKVQISVLGLYQIEDHFLVGFFNILELIQYPKQKCALVVGIFD